jgi:hypothetical protein
LGRGLLGGCFWCRHAYITATPVHPSWLSKNRVIVFQNCNNRLTQVHVVFILPQLVHIEEFSKTEILNCFFGFSSTKKKEKKNTKTTIRQKTQNLDKFKHEQQAINYNSLQTNFFSFFVRLLS